MLGLAVIVDRGRRRGRDPAHRRHRGRRPTSSTCCSSACRWRSPPCPRGCRRSCRSCSRSACSAWPASTRSSRSCRRSRRWGRRRWSARTRPGTLTRNEMTIEKVVTASGEVDVTGSGYRPEGELRVDGRPLDDPVAARRGPRRARRRQPGQRRRAARGRRRVDDPGRSRPRPRSSSPRRRSRARPRRGEARFERVGEVPFTSERKLMSTLAGRRRARGRHRRRHQGRARRAARALHRRARRRRGAPAHRRPPRARCSPRSTGSPTSRCARWPSPTGRCPTASRPPRGRVDRARARLPRHGRHHRPAAPGGARGHRRGARPRACGSS